jgi:hypothetical protein
VPIGTRQAGVATGIPIAPADPGGSWGPPPAAGGGLEIVTHDSVVISKIGDSVVTAIDWRPPYGAGHLILIDRIIVSGVNNGAPGRQVDFYVDHPYDQEAWVEASLDYPNFAGENPPIEFPATSVFWAVFRATIFQFQYTVRYQYRVGRLV